MTDRLHNMFTDTLEISVAALKQPFLSLDLLTKLTYTHNITVTLNMSSSPLQYNTVETFCHSSPELITSLLST